MTISIILLAIVALAFATRQLLRANNEEQRDTHIDVDTFAFGPVPQRHDTLPSPMLEELTGEPAPVLKLELPPLDDLPDVTDDAVESQWNGFTKGGPVVAKEQILQLIEEQDRRDAEEAAEVSAARSLSERPVSNPTCGDCQITLMCSHCYSRPRHDGSRLCASCQFEEVKGQQ